jgi:hypothetical protein
MTTNPKVLAYLRTDRLWFREHRIASARHRLSIAAPDQKQFWLDVLEALGETKVVVRLGGATNVN